MTLRSLLRSCGALSATALFLSPVALGSSAEAAPVAGWAGAGQQQAHQTPIAGSGQVCSPPRNSIGGHVKGSDGRFVNVTLTLTLSDAKGNEVDANGCPLNHDSPAFLVSPNYSLPSDGSAADGTDLWQITGLPANAKDVHVEVYPRGSASSDRYLRTDTSHYGRTMVKVALPTSKDVNVIVPRDDDCPSPHGVGSATAVGYDVHVSKKAGARTAADIGKVWTTPSAVSLADAFSAWADTPGIADGAQGLSLGSAPVDGTVYLPNLLGGGKHGQPYTFVVRTAHYSGRAYSTDYRGRQTFGVTSCSHTTVKVMSLPTTLTTTERHQVGDWLLAHVRQFVVSNNR